MCEFTGMDFEMEITNHYHEILHLVHYLFKFIFEKLENDPKFKQDIQIIRQTYNYKPLVIPDTPLILSFAEGVKLLRENGIEVNDFEDFSTPTEIKLGEIVKAKFNADFYIIGLFIIYF